jgi:ribosome-associated protein
MSEDSILTVNDQLRVPRAELDFRASRSGGPGGQHVNTSSTRVELLWDVEGSPSLTGEQRERIREKLANRIDGEGVLHLTASEHRSQHQNREAATGRFVEIVREALRVPKARKKTRPTRASREQRLRGKKRRSEVKRLRGGVPLDE